MKLVTRTITDIDDTSKKGIVVTARVHPGETNSSWMMKGLLDFITGPSNTAKVKSLDVEEFSLMAPFIKTVVTFMCAPIVQ